MSELVERFGHSATSLREDGYHDPANHLDEAISTINSLETENAILRDVLKQVATWRQSCHDYDRDTGAPLRDFDDEDWRMIEHVARAALKAEGKRDE